jgi:hypothetical protein
LKARTQAVIATVATLSVVACALLAWQLPTPDGTAVTAALGFSAFMLIGGAAPYRLHSNQGSGSVSFISVIAGVSVAPTWFTAFAFAATQAILELVLRRPLRKAVFNVAQYLLSSSLAIATYVVLDPIGQSLGIGQLLPLVAAYFAFTITNTGSVAWVIAVDTRSKLGEVWIANTSHSFVTDIVTIPIAWALAALFQQYGFLVASAAAASLFIVRQLNGANEELARTNTELLELTVTTLEARDPFTSGHSRRVARYAKVIGQRIGLAGRDLERLSAAALLHDVGKIHEVFVPVLSKPGRLTQEERALMETHPVKGADLVSISSHLRDLVEPIRHHHEAWDGTGYPDALVGEKIPLFSRIIAVADTIDAMASDRPYRTGLSAEVIRSEIVKNRGRQFDPQLVDRLEGSGVLDALLSVACQRSDTHESEFDSASAPKEHPALAIA